MANIFLPVASLLPLLAFTVAVTVALWIPVKLMGGAHRVAIDVPPVDLSGQA
jgi:hypothetical protein